MDARYNKYAICFGERNTKQGALFFERVFPVTLDEILPSANVPYGISGISKHQTQRAKDIFKSLLGSGNENVLFSRSEMLTSIHSEFSSIGHNSHSFSEYMAENYFYNKEVFTGLKLRDTLQPLIVSLGFKNAAVLLPDLTIINERKGGASNNSISIFDLELVDVDKAPWEQILELRKDITGSAKLRNLRLFFEKNFQGKEKSFIEDSLEKAICDYKETAAEHGFKTKLGMCSMLFKKESAFGVGVAALIQHLYGAPITAISVGAVINFANIGFYIAKQKRLIKTFKNNHEVAYLIELDKKLMDRKKSNK